jgi:hypothetical protein
LTITDLAVAERQLGRIPRALAGVAARCRAGHPSVLVQAPYDARGVPFPTLYWLSCPALVDAVGRLEGAGGIAQLQRELDEDAALGADRAAVEARVQAVRRSLAHDGPMLDEGAALVAGIAGEAPGGGLKCLHSHAAAALADPPYLLGARVLALAGVDALHGCCVE